MHCHGITGDGDGPTAAFLNPYPRDYRRGWFKYKSTRRDDEPTTENLLRIVTDGIQGTAMPAFKLYPQVDREALVEYVKYLSMRGQMELALDRYVANNLTKETDPVPSDPAFLQGQLSTIAEAVARSRLQVAVGDRPDDMKIRQASPIPSRGKRPAIGRSPSAGRCFCNEKPGVARLPTAEEDIKYFGGGCIKCHGPTELGDGQTTDYDDWTKQIWGKEAWNGKDAAGVGVAFRWAPCRSGTSSRAICGWACTTAAAGRWIFTIAFTKESKARRCRRTPIRC